MEKRGKGKHTHKKKEAIFSRKNKYKNKLFFFYVTLE